MRAFAHAPTEPRRVLILGGGFGGIYAALELEKVLARHGNGTLDVTLVTRDNFFLFTPMLHEVAASDLELNTIVNPLRKLLRRVNTFVGGIEAIDLEARRVTVSHGLDAHTHELPYDHLVLALGSSTNFYGLPGVEECALTIKSLGDAVALRNRLISHLEEANSECAAGERQPLLTFVVALSMMIAIDARLTLISLIPLPFVSISVKFFGSAIHRRFEQIQAQLSEVSAVAQEALSGVRVVRAYRQESAELERFRRSNQEYLLRNRRLIALQGFFFPSMSFFLGLGALIVLWLGSREVIRGRITLGEFVAFNSYLTMLSWPMIAFGWVTNMLQRGMASWKRMLEVLETEPSIGDAIQLRSSQSAPSQVFSADSAISAFHPRAIRGAIEFRDLVFAFGDMPVLNHVSARIEAGQTAALVGVTGSGKSTLISLLARLHDPPPASVFIDGIDVRDFPIAVLRGAIGFVPQEPFLFSDTLADNIAFGLDAIEGPGGSGGSASRDRKIQDAAAVARLDKDVADFPKGYDTMVGERGITLSGGQKQRTALARAIVIDPRILILDDSLSAVDTYTEEEILSRLRGVMRERTSIIVSHRISTVRDADVIFVLDQGRIVERGTHDDLVRANGLYAELHKKQLLEEELAAS